MQSPRRRGWKSRGRALQAFWYFTPLTDLCCPVRGLEHDAVAPLGKGWDSQLAAAKITHPLIA